VSTKHQQLCPYAWARAKERIDELLRATLDRHLDALRQRCANYRDRTMSPSVSMLP